MKISNVSQKIVQFLRENKNEEALGLVKQAMSKFSRDFQLLKLAGIASARLENWLDAEIYFRAALVEKKDDEDTIFQLSKVFKLSNQVDKNICHLDAYLDRCPNDFRVLNEIGMLFFSKGWSDLAINCFSKVVKINSKYREAYHNLAAVYFSIGKYQEASNVTRLAIPLCDKVDAFGLRADLIVYLSRASLLDEAQEIADDLLCDFEEEYQVSRPDLHGVILNNVGLLSMAVNEPVRAEQLFLSAIEINPKHIDPYINMARLCAYNESFSHAIDWFERALVIDPGHVNLHEHFASFLRYAGRPEMALRHHHEVLSRTPEAAASWLSLCQTQFMLGDLDNAYKNYEFRWSCPESGFKPLTHLPEWSGSPSFRRSIFVYREQGIGDELIFAGALPDLQQKFESVYYACHPKLKALFKRSFPSVHCVLDYAEVDSSAKVECTIALGSLAAILRPSIASFNTVAPYLVSNSELVEEYKSRFHRETGQIIVGIAWRSAMQALNRRSVYPPLNQWAAIFAVPNIIWVNLQYGDFASEIRAAHQDFGVEIVDFQDVDHYNDLDKSVALMKTCDVVVGPGTSTTMLSGAAGIPTLRIADDADEFKLGTDYYPWLPSMIPIGRKFGEGWSIPIEKVASILRGLVDNSI